MIEESVENKIRVFKTRFMFSRYKFQLRFLVAPFFVLFGLLDYWYQPEKVATWVAYRLIFFAAVWLLFIPIVKYRKHRRLIQIHLAIITALACNIINVMIYQSGGYSSKYFIGVILCAVAGSQLFKLNKSYSFAVQVLAYAPTIWILIHTSPGSELKNSIIQALFFVGMAILSYIFGSSDEDNTSILIKIRQKMKVEIQRLNKTEMLKRFFPLVVRNEIESNPDAVTKKRKMANMVVGFADISNSTQIANSIELELDWSLKEKFLEAATSLALKNDLVVLTHLGDGFLFLANYVNKEVWQENLIHFFLNLTKEYEKIYASSVGISGSIRSGVKFGLARGDIMLGFLGSDQAYFTATGPTVNLAARVCSKAVGSELMVTSELWRDLESFTGALSNQRMPATELKGFNNKWELIRISVVNSKTQSGVLKCHVCSSTMALDLNASGFLDYICKLCPGIKDNVA